jgi:hypothetical protein
MYLGHKRLSNLLLLLLLLLLSSSLLLLLRHHNLLNTQLQHKGETAIFTQDGGDVLALAQVNLTADAHALSPYLIRLYLHALPFIKMEF